MSTPLEWMDIEHQKALLRGRREDQMQLLPPHMAEMLARVAELRYLGLGAPQNLPGQNNMGNVPGMIPGPSPIELGRNGQRTRTRPISADDPEMLNALMSLRQPTRTQKK